MEFIHSTMTNARSVTANTVVTDDLPVNPLSHILITLNFAQDQANTQLTFSNIAAMIDRIEVLFKGSAVYSSNGIDLMALGIFIAGFESWGVNADGDDNNLRSFTFCLPLTRKLYSPLECFPRSSRGELQLQITYASSFTQIDAVTETVETIELPEATPQQYLKSTVLQRTPAATGEFDIDLPIGNKISDLVLFGTTIPAGSTATTTIDDVQVLRDNIRRYYSNATFETIHNMAGRMRAAPGYWAAHVHRLLGAAFSQFDDVSAVIAADHILSNHIHVPFDVTGDGTYIMDTLGASDLVLRIDAGDTNAVRCIPCEIVSV